SAFHGRSGALKMWRHSRPLYRSLSERASRCSRAAVGNLPPRDLRPLGVQAYNNSRGTIGRPFPPILPLFSWDPSCPKTPSPPPLHPPRQPPPRAATTGVASPPATAVGPATPSPAKWPLSDRP